MKVLDIKCLKDWFFRFRRPLPWRENSSPYAVWVSEVMLQQTQASVVIPYFQRWMRLFPTVQALAAASYEEVVKAWEGLGYYSRVRNLHEGARYLVHYQGGELPEEVSVLQKIKGIGPYTMGAIRSFAFKQKAAAVDGNVLRVFSRLFAIENPIDQQKTRRQIEKLVMEILPDNEPWIIMEALIELGALVCQKKPHCMNCPLKGSCLAFQNKKIAIFPKRRKKIPTTFLHRLVTIIQNDTCILLTRREQGEVMAGLWEFPYFTLSQPLEDVSNWHTHIENHFSLRLTYHQSLPEQSHGFTRYKAFLYPHIWRTIDTLEISNHTWVPLKELTCKPFSSGHRRLLTYLSHSCISH